MSTYNAGAVKQDLPPPGGYEEINYRRIPAQRIIGAKAFFVTSCILTAYSTFYYIKRMRYMKRLMVDYYDHAIAIEPLIRAENDRAFLRHLRHNRNVERDLMKNVPDWTVGTLWGAKVYKTLPDDALPNISPREYWGHRGAKDHREFFLPNYDVGLEETCLSYYD
ncbi:NADH dehydrogenase [ubiquinone] 1 alpha subcomplex subunit 13 [Sarcoptes scabiei]|uniref:NADH dehydrogenase [ubiquinone] 1 alpha subcomplex subunit 13 n=1 Tax=Sarcoptes scabiei TaxID=52283 RepID=A0A132A9Q1_SARSC|nr:NADH dehydrogenase [ubiquinone] 1 alpha subcomplex subunit 13 [Sarcoptes scabiei]KPM07672.1 NADH dehydrogenase [ubiquinone] 1 alpha subcomplex subunit 13-like protein [Sarcoptes scabiei]UXI15449.1 HEAT repeat-containing protein 1 [Sarcoptes scabiei]